MILWSFAGLIALHPSPLPRMQMNTLFSGQHTLSPECSESIVRIHGVLRFFALSSILSAESICLDCTTNDGSFGGLRIDSQQ